MQQDGVAHWIGLAITAAIIVPILVFRLRRMRRASPLRLERLWIVPALYAVLAAVVFWNAPPHGLQWYAPAVALVVGLAVGWWRGAFMRITVDPETHALNQQNSPAAMLILLAVILLRQALNAEAPRIGLDVSLMTDMLIAFALGLLAATRAEVFLRASRLLTAARAARAETA
jgi:hypothetical protein